MVSGRTTRGRSVVSYWSHNLAADRCVFLFSSRGRQWSSRQWQAWACHRPDIRRCCGRGMHFRCRKFAIVCTSPVAAWKALRRERRMPLFGGCDDISRDMPAIGPPAVMVVAARLWSERRALAGEIAEASRHGASRSTLYSQVAPAFRQMDEWNFRVLRDFLGALAGVPATARRGARGCRCHRPDHAKRTL